MTGIELPCFYTPEEEDKLQQLGLSEKDSLENCEVDNMTFYHIDCISRDTDKRYSNIYSSGICFICTYSYEKLKQVLKEVRGVL